MVVTDDLYMASPDDILHLLNEVREGVEAWRATGIKTVILVPSSTRGGQMKAFEELIAAFR